MANLREARVVKRRRVSAQVGVNHTPFYTKGIGGTTVNIRSTRQCAVLFAVALTSTSTCTVLASVQTGEAPVGQPASAVEARFDTPPERYPRAGGGTRWLYPTQPYGQFTYAVDFNASGKLVSFRQILTTMDPTQIRVGTATQNDVLQTFGKSEEAAHFRLMDRQVWSYRFKHEGVWPSLMHFYLDRDGVVRLTQVSPDPIYDHNHDSSH